MPVLSRHRSPWFLRKWGMNRRAMFERLEPRTLLAGDISLIRYFDVWDGGIIRSTDVAGIGYHEPSGHLYLVDSEMDELAPPYDEIDNGNNIFEVSLRGDEVFREIASNNIEPTGITYSPFDGFFYVTNDDKQTLTRYDHRLDTPLATVDPRDDVASARDPEDVAADPVSGMLYVADGKSGGTQVLVYNANLVFQYSFSVASHVADPEGIAFHPTLRRLFLTSKPDHKIFEYTLDGVFVEEYDISGFSPKPRTEQGLVFAPTSDPHDAPDAIALYIVDGGTDNYPDGWVYEARIGPGQPGIQPTIHSRIAASSDDAEERLSSGGMYTTSGDLEMAFDASRDQIVGLRFNDLAIPPGATIQNAYIQFQVEEADNEPTSLIVQGEATDHAATFTTTDRDISSRPRTAASVPWSPAPWTTVGEAGPAQRTPDISAVIQEIVHRPGWASGNSLAILITGSGVRTAEAYDGVPAAAPMLYVELTGTQTPHNAPPLLDAGTDPALAMSGLSILTAASPRTEDQPDREPANVVALDEFWLAVGTGEARQPRLAISTASAGIRRPDTMLLDLPSEGAEETDENPFVDPNAWPTALADGFFYKLGI